MTGGSPEEVDAAHDPALLDRAAGALLGVACGDALGVPYEFAAPPGPGEDAAMRGGGLGAFAPGEWSDDTDLTAVVALVAAGGTDLRDERALDRVAAGFGAWFAHGPADIGVHTRALLGTVGPSPTAATLRAAAAGLHAETGRTAGNGALMRTAAVALAHLDDPQATAAAARAVSDLTHADPLSAEACVLWCAGVGGAVRDATLTGVRDGVGLLPAGRRDAWISFLDEAEAGPPGRFRPNGYVVTALQAAWSAVHATPPDGPGHLAATLHAAVRVGDDTDTVAAIAGALVGARWGASAVPAGWRAAVHGWPGLTGEDLAGLGAAIVTRSPASVPTPF